MLLMITEQMAIVDVVTGFDQMGLDTFLAQAGAPRLATFSSANLPMPVVALSFIQWLDQNDNFIEAVLRRMVAQFPAHNSAPLLQQALNRTVRAGQAAAASQPWETPLIAGVPMVNRAPLRSTLARLLGGHGPEVTLVDGPAGSGRSHSWYLIEHVARSVATVFPLKIDLNAPVLAQQTIDVVARQLLSKLRLPQTALSTSEGATPDTVADRFAEDIANAWNARPAGGPKPWIVFDSLDRAVAPEIRSFVCALVQRRLSHEIDSCVFFLLGAGRDYGVVDPFLVVDVESLTVFSDAEVQQAAGALNALGSRPLSAADFHSRLQDMHKLLAQGGPRVACAAVSRKLAELRREVNA